MSWWIAPAALAALLGDAPAGAEPLPAVVLVGDSIRMGYADVVADRLQGRARVISAPENGSFSRKVMHHLDDWAIRHRPSVVHFGAGLHDIMTEPTTGRRLVEPVEYRANLRAIARRLHDETSARLIFATTTPVLESRRGDRPTYRMTNADIRAYNDLARRALAPWPTIAIDDLHARALDFGLDRALMRDGVHFTREGSVALGEAAAESILRALADPPIARAIECRRVPRPPVVDGRVDGDPAWVDIPPIGPFAQFWGGRDAPGRAEVRLAWDDGGFWFAATLADDRLVAAGRRPNGPTWLGDALGLVIWPDEARPGFGEFQVDPAGATLQMASPGPGADYAALAAGPPLGMVAAALSWEDAAQSTRGWAVEGRIPWAALGPPAGPPAPGASWRVVALRTDSDGPGSRPALTSAAPLRRPDVHRRDEASRLVFLP